MDRVQLGTLQLDLRATGEAALSNTATSTWFPLTTDFLDAGLLNNFSTSDDLVTLLAELLADPGIGFGADCQVAPPHLVVRCSLIPSDGHGGDWRKRPKKDRSRTLRRLFAALKHGWDGDGGGDWVLAKRPEDHLRISELYSCIASPKQPEARDWTPLSVGDEDTHSRILRGDDIKGIKTTLFKYQLRSVNRMIQMESEPKQLVDPGVTEFWESGKTRKYYVNLANYDIQLHPGQYNLPQGGILCEQMGVGKSLISLAVIISTLHQPAQIPPHEVDISPAVTAHQLHTYPFGPAADVRSRLPRNPPLRTDLALPSLAELCANILASRDRSAVADVGPHMSKLLTQRVCYYKYPPDTSCMRAAKAVYINDEPERIYLSKTTLLVVPPMLIEQWLHEIEKHVEGGAMSVLKVEGELPSIHKLLEYDVILMNVNDFGREHPLTRARLDLGPSELLNARWKRIILDEGHVAGTATVDAMRFARMLNIERSWVVTGTPTKHLQQGGELQAAAGIKNEELASTAVAPAGKWSSRDLDDVARLGGIIGGFLGAEPFHSDITFSEAITSHLRRREIPLGSVGRLKYLMDSLMVKHCAEEVDEEASLPPTMVETVVLPFEPMQRLSFNVLASLIIANVYACDFEDPDYLLHPKNLKSFQQVVKNLHIACLWFSAIQVDAAGSLTRLENDIENKANLTDANRAIMREAAEHLQRAIETPGWSEWMRYGVSLPVHIPSLPLGVKDAWSDSMTLDSDWIDVHSATKIRDLNDNGMMIDELVETGDLMLDRKKAEASAELDRVTEAAERKQQKLEKRGLVVAQSDAAQTPNKVSPRKKAPAKGAKIDQALAQATRNAQLAIDVEAKAHLPRPLPLTAKVKTRSHKMNYVVQTIRSSLPDDKFVIFGDSAELGLCSEVLEFFDISWVYAGAGTSRKTREGALDEYQKTDIKACLLEPRIGARGLNLVVANRMILLAPMWNLDTQAQAIKRIHRIGQTRPTKVEILVTQDTFEEDIARRASTTRTENEEKLYTRNLIERPRFAYVEEDSAARYTVRLAPVGATEATNHDTERQNRAARDARIPRSATSTPEPALVTPVSGAMRHMSIKEESPTPEVLGQKRGLSPGIEHIEEDVKPKKKARVAFA